MSGGFFRGTSADQDTRFSNKQAKLLKTQKFAPELEHLVDVGKVKMDVIKPWIATRVTELLGGFEDEVLINFIYGLLEGKEINGKAIQIQLTGFMEKNTGKFMKELWELLLSAQKNSSGVPQQFLDAKEEETKKKKAESDRIFNEIQRRREKESEQEKEKRLDGGRDKNFAEDANRRQEKGPDAQSRDENGADVRNGFLGRNRSPKSPYSSDWSASPNRERSVSKSVSPRPRKQSVSPNRIRRTPQRSISPRRRSVCESISPRQRSHSRRSSSRTRYRSPSPMRRRLRSPVNRRSSAAGRRSPSPIRRRSPWRHRSPPRGRRSRSPWRRRSPSPRRRRSPSLRRRRSPSPVRQRRRRSTSSPRSRSPVQLRSRSPVQRRSRSPVQRRSRSPVQSRSQSPVQRRSQSPVRRRYRSPFRRRSPYTVRRRSPPLDRRGSPSPRPRRSPSPVRRRSPVRARRSPTRSPSRSHSPDSRSSASPARRGSPSPITRQSPGRSSPHGSPSERTRLNNRAEPAGRQSMAMSPQRDQYDGNRSRWKVPSKSPSPAKSRSYSPENKSRSAACDRRLASPKGAGDRMSPEASRSPKRVRRGSPGTSKDDLCDARVDEQNKHKSSEKRTGCSSGGKNRESPDRPSDRYSTVVSRSKDTETPSVEDSPKQVHTGKRPPHRGSISKEGAVSYPADSSKSDERKNSNSKDAKANSRSVALAELPKKRRSPSISSDHESEGIDKPKLEISEKRKHKRCSRRDAVSESTRSESEIEDRKDAKRRKEKRKVRKEERRQRREERHRKREEKRASKRKRKSKNADASSSDLEKIEKIGNASNGERGMRKYSSEEEEGESLKKRLEIELREKALQSLRAKKGIGR